MKASQASSLPPPAPSMLRRRVRVALGLLLLIQTGLLGGSAWVHSPNGNEHSHLAAGLHHYRTADFSLYRVNPPLVRLIATLPALAMDHEEDFSAYQERIGARPVFQIGADLVRANGPRTMRLVRAGRLALLPIMLLGTLLCFRWASLLAGGEATTGGATAGLTAAGLFAIEPMMIGHGSMLTPDAAASVLGLAACYTFWRWLAEPTWYRAISTGVVLGFAEAAKTTLVVLYPLWPVVWLIYRWRQRRHAGNSPTAWFWRETFMLLARMAIGLYILNLVYLGEGTFTQLGKYRFVSEMLRGDDNDGPGGNRFEQSLLGRLPIPLPANYVIGIDVQQEDFEHYHKPGYLRGQFSDEGWWYYYLYALLVKLPTTTLALLGWSLVVGWSQRHSWSDYWVVLSPAVVIFMIASSKTGINDHSRYVLPCLPLIFVAAGAALGQWAAAGRVGTNRSRILAVALLLGGSALGSLSTYPHSLSHFNILAGGPKRGHEHLLGSNLDWGQDLWLLRSWGNQHADGQTVHVASQNFYDPLDLLVNQNNSADHQYKHWPQIDGSIPVPRGWYAISANVLYEKNALASGDDGETILVDDEIRKRLSRIEPTAWVGHTVRVFSASQIDDASEH